MPRIVAMVLGALTGVVTLIAMLRLISGAFSVGMSRFALGFALAATIPFIVYAAWRARRARLTPRRTTAVLALSAVGLIVVWLFTIGPVLALACALAAFALIWVSDLPVRRPASDAEFVRIEDLQRDDDED